MSTATATFIHIGNLEDLDPFEWNYSVENPSPIFQTFTSNDMTNAQVVQNDANGDGRLLENDFGQTADTFTYDVGNGLTTSGLDNAARYSVNYIDETGAQHSTHVSVYQTENGDAFVRFPNGLQVKSMEITGKVSDHYYAIRHGTSSTSRAVCFASGTYIETPDGLRKIDTLHVGDLVMTLDHGPCPIRWIHSAVQPLLLSERDESPVLVKKGALGWNRPLRDLVVSPQHRILVGGYGQLEAFPLEQVLAPAKALTGLPGIRHMRGKRQIKWVHIAFDRHEMIFANGCISESLLLGQMVLAGIPKAQKRVLLDMFGPDVPLNGPALRPCAKVTDVRERLSTMALA